MGIRHTAGAARRRWRIDQSSLETFIARVTDFNSAGGFSGLRNSGTLILHLNAHLIHQGELHHGDSAHRRGGTAEMENRPELFGDLHCASYGLQFRGRILWIEKFRNRNLALEPTLNPPGRIASWGFGTPQGRHGGDGESTRALWRPSLRELRTSIPREDSLD